MDQIIATLKTTIEEAVKKTFSTHLSAPPQVSDHETALEDRLTILTSIELTGKITGAFAVCLSFDNARKIVSKMLGQELTKENASDIYDGIGELTNITLGLIKNSLVNSGFPNIAIGIPFTIQGTHLDCKLPSNSKSIVLHFSCEDVTFLTIFMYKIINH